MTAPDYDTVALENEHLRIDVGRLQIELTQAKERAAFFDHAMNFWLGQTLAFCPRPPVELAPANPDPTNLGAEIAQLGAEIAETMGELASERAERESAAAAFVIPEWLANLPPVEPVPSVKRRVDRDGRDVTDLPGLWDEGDDEEMSDLMRLLAYARQWDADVAELRTLARSERIEQAAWAVRTSDLWPESATSVGAPPSEFDTALQALYAALVGGQG